MKMQLKLISFFGTCTCFERRDTKSEHAFEAPRPNDLLRVPDHQPRAFHLGYLFNECFDRAENRRVDLNRDFPPSVPRRACTKTTPSTRTTEDALFSRSFSPSLPPSSILSTYTLWFLFFLLPSFSLHDFPLQLLPPHRLLPQPALVLRAHVTTLNPERTDLAFQHLVEEVMYHRRDAVLVLIRFGLGLGFGLG